MYTVPSEFQRELDNVFHGRFRIRWSQKKEEFQLEQKVGTGQVLLPPPVDPDAPSHFDTYSDEWVRARDGYFFIMSLRNGDRMPCPVCGLEVPVPIMETTESICEHCRIKGRDGKYRAAFYPFNHILIQHIMDIDPYFDNAHHIRDRMRARQIAKMARTQKDAIDAADYAVINSKNQVEDNPMTGYGPKTTQHSGARFYEAGDEFTRSQSGKR
jgi:hypothetical protein